MIQRASQQEEVISFLELFSGEEEATKAGLRHGRWSIGYDYRKDPVHMDIIPKNQHQEINAATINGAYAMGLSHKTGSITKGKIANIIITSEIESINDLPYFYGDNLVDKTLINGEEIIQIKL